MMVGMNKIELFLPLPGKTEAMNEYFRSSGVWYLNGLPTGPELPSEDLSEAELLEIAFEVAKDKVFALTYTYLGEDDVYDVSNSSPFIDQFYDNKGEFIGWEFEFDVYQR